jgi:hypothetical protein
LTHEYEGSSERVETKVATQPVDRIVEAERMHLTCYEIDNDGSATFAALTGSNGVARFTFSLPSADYSIDVRYLSESVGQNTHAMYVANDQIVAWLGKDRDDQWHLPSEQKWHAPHHIAINTGDEIRIEALSDNGTLGLLDYVAFTAIARPTSAPPRHIARPTPSPTTTTTWRLTRLLPLTRPCRQSLSPPPPRRLKSADYQRQGQTIVLALPLCP